MVSCVAVLSLFFVSLVQAQAGSKQKKGVAWLSPQAAQARLQVAPKPLLIDVYTTWCQYCRLMDATTWRHDSVAAYVAEHFIAIKFDAESKLPVSWQGSEYVYQPRFKVHQLAVSWLQGNMVYPSTVLVPPQGSPQVIPGALQVREAETLLKYYGSGAYLQQRFEDFRQGFSPNW
jgi:thioredoxin-related protein